MPAGHQIGDHGGFIQFCIHPSADADLSVLVPVISVIYCVTKLVTLQMVITAVADAAAFQQQEVQSASLSRIQHDVHAITFHEKGRGRKLPDAMSHAISVPQSNPFQRACTSLQLKSGFPRLLFTQLCTSHAHCWSSSALLVAGALLL